MDKVKLLAPEGCPIARFTDADGAEYVVKDGVVTPDIERSAIPENLWGFGFTISAPTVSKPLKVEKE